MTIQEDRMRYPFAQIEDEVLKHLISGFKKLFILLSTCRVLT